MCCCVCVCVCPQVEILTPLAAPPLHSSAPSGLPWALGPPVSAPFISPVLLLLPGQLHLDTTLPEQSPWGWGWGSTYVLGDLDIGEGVLAGLGRQGPDAEGRGEDGQAGGRDHFSLRTGAKRRHQSRGSTPGCSPPSVGDVGEGGGTDVVCRFKEHGLAGVTVATAGQLFPQQRRGPSLRAPSARRRGEGGADTDKKQRGKQRPSLVQLSAGC